MIDKNRKIEIMGIVNTTDDSFYSGSRCSSTDLKAFSAKVDKMLGEGADIIDIGACSTRPGSEYVPESVEWGRLKPVLEEASVCFKGVRFSIDTFRSEIVKRSADIIGEFIVNDISAGEDDDAMLGTVASLGFTYIAMHKRGTPLNMQMLAEYKDVTTEVYDYFRSFAKKAESAGIKSWILDPGFGFAKTVEQNLKLMSELEKFKELGRPVLAGISRKSFIYKPLGLSPDTCLDATSKYHLNVLARGADILRVHDIAPALEVVREYKAL